MNYSFGWILLLLAVGCQRAPQPVAYHGEATLDERPIATGQILLVVPGEPPETAEIIDGKFKGVALPGVKRVEIYAYRPGAVFPDNPFPLPVEGDPLENFAPEEFNLKSTLSAEITPSGPNEFEFALTSTSP